MLQRIPRLCLLKLHIILFDPSGFYIALYLVMLVWTIVMADLAWWKSHVYTGSLLLRWTFLATQGLTESEGVQIWLFNL